MTLVIITKKKKKKKKKKASASQCKQYIFVSGEFNKFFLFLVSGRMKET